MCIKYKHETSKAKDDCVWIGDLFVCWGTRAISVGDTSFRLRPYISALSNSVFPLPTDYLPYPYVPQTVEPIEVLRFKPNPPRGLLFRGEAFRGGWLGTKPEAWQFTDMGSSVCTWDAKLSPSPT